MEITHRNFEEIDDFPKTVYKYRDWCNPYHKTILSSQTVFMAPPSSFEDQMDCKLCKRYDLLTDRQIYEKYLYHSQKENPGWSPKQHQQFAKEWFEKSPLRNKEHVKKMQVEHLQKHDSLFGVLSLTANPENTAMWGKYSDKHKGFCVGFNSKEMFQYLGGGGDVKYYDELPVILPTDSYDEEYVKQVFSKERKWEFEEEYRTHKTYPHPTTNENRKIELPKTCYHKIIFGAEMTETNKVEITKTCVEQNLIVEYFDAIYLENKIVGIKRIVI